MGRKIVRVKAKGKFFSQGDPPDGIFYLRTGRVRLTVVSKAGKEATISLLGPGHFIGEESISGFTTMRMASATAMTNCVALHLEREEMLRVIHEERKFAELFLKFVMARSLRTQADLIDQLFNSSEKRLARVLLLMAEFGRHSAEDTLIPRVTHETLAEMVGTTRPRVSFFMNRFRKLGLIDYKTRIRVKRSLLDVVLHDKLPDQNAQLPDTLSDKPDPRPTALTGRKKRNGENL